MASNLCISNSLFCLYQELKLYEYQIISFTYMFVYI